MRVVIEGEGSLDDDVADGASEFAFWFTWFASPFYTARPLSAHCDQPGLDGQTKSVNPVASTYFVCPPIQLSLSEGWRGQKTDSACIFFTRRRCPHNPISLHRIGSNPIERSIPPSSSLSLNSSATIITQYLTPSIH